MLFFSLSQRISSLLHKPQAQTTGPTGWDAHCLPLGIWGGRIAQYDYNCLGVLSPLLSFLPSPLLPGPLVNFYWPPVASSLEFPVVSFLAVRAI